MTLNIKHGSIPLQRGKEDRNNCGNSTNFYKFRYGDAHGCFITYDIDQFYPCWSNCVDRKTLIGTWYSNYSRRMNMLSGTARLLNNFGIYTDVNEPGTYLMVGDVQDVREDESNVKLAEITPIILKG